MITKSEIANEIKNGLLVILIVMSPFIIYVILLCTIALYTPSMVTGTVQFINYENTDEPCQIILRGEGNNILGNKDVWVHRYFDTTDEIICERENITDGDKVVFNSKGIILYKIDE